MTWQESVGKAIQRHAARTGNPLFTRRQLMDSGIRQIVAETASTGETPEQTLSRVLQELRDQGMIKFESPGVYRLLKLIAKAYPRKNFFVQMFTKDISLEDCVLDLIDNSVDGFIKSRDLRLSEIASGIWEKGSVAQFVGDFLGNSSLDIRGAPMGGGERVRYAWRPAATR
ncbi:MAG: hypothetical protein ABSE16_16460, partial [Verrucomicrobiota bacterium]